MKYLFLGLGTLCFCAAIYMYLMRNDSHLSELGSFYFVPIPLGILSIVYGVKLMNKK